MMPREITPCVNYSELFQHPLLDDAPPLTGRGQRKEQAMLRNQASKLCADCPMLSQCLTDAVTKFEVSGFVAGTTKRQRQEIRAELDVELAADDIDRFAGVSSSRQYDRYEIYRLRAANPDQPLSTIAAKLGCSVSTVKRHLRRVEEENDAPIVSHRDQPSPAEVMAAARRVAQAKRQQAA